MQIIFNTLYLFNKTLYKTMSKYRIVLNDQGLYEIEKKVFLGWNVVKEWDGCDSLGFDYGYSAKTFNNVDDAEKHIEILKNEYKRKIIKYV